MPDRKKLQTVRFTRRKRRSGQILQNDALMGVVERSNEDTRAGPK